VVSRQFTGRCFSCEVEVPPAKAWRCPDTGQLLRRFVTTDLWIEWRDDKATAGRRTPKLFTETLRQALCRSRNYLIERREVTGH
jgi:hypothetical protein